MRAFFVLLCSVSSLYLSACTEIPVEAYANRGVPESLLDVSSETVSVELSSEASLDELQEWVESDQPTRAIIYCAEGDVLCDSAEQSLDVYGVEYEWMVADYSEVALIYERVIAHDCENRFIDNRINPYNLNHPSFGCSVASNMVQMVTNRQEFVSPQLLGFVDGRSAAKSMRAHRYFNGRQYFTTNASSNLNVGSISFQGSQ
jgi:hypothetical protein